MMMYIVEQFWGDNCHSWMFLRRVWNYYDCRIWKDFEGRRCCTCSLFDCTV